jgi:hypothetical protein
MQFAKATVVAFYCSQHLRSGYHIELSSFRKLPIRQKLNCAIPQIRSIKLRFGSFDEWFLLTVI